MQSSTRIDELRARFYENPRRYFAPLANEYRKAGDPEQAIAICRAHLTQQPGHMSGHVVCAQALFDAQRTDEARTVFEQALALDPDNVIVLRHLGDIARESGETAEARHWYTRGLNSDPHDTEIAAYLAQLTEPLGIAAPPSSAHGSPVDAESSAESTGALVGAPSEEPAAVARESSDDVELVHEAPLAEDVDAVPGLQPEVDLEPVLEPVHETDVEPVREPALEVEVEAVREPGPEVDLEEIREPPPPSAPDVPESLFGGDAEPLDAHSPEVGVESTGDARLDADVEPVDPAVSTIPRERGPFVTSTMAELYIQQGFKARALEIYQQLASERPDDCEIADRLSALSLAAAAIEPDGERATNEQFEDATETESTPLPADELGSPTSSVESHFTETELVGGGDSWDTDNWAAGFSSTEAVDYGDLHSPDVESESGNAAGAELLADAGKLDTNLIADRWGEADPAEDLAVEQSDSKPVADLGVAQSDSDLVAYAPLTPTLFGGNDAPDPGPADADQVTASDFGGVPDTLQFNERMPKRGPTIREFFATLGAKRPPGHAAPDGQVAGDLAPPLASAFDDLFPGEVISGEHSRAAFALSGAVGGLLPPSAQAATTEMPHTKAAAAASPPGGGSPQPAAAAAAPSSAEAGQESEEDIRKFREWLDGLAQS